MTGLRLYNTLTRQIEPLKPLAPPRVTFYTCGPTVWNYAHIGNFRTFLFEDLLRRWLEARGADVYHIMNLTDVDDRIIREAGARGADIREFVQPYIEAFYQDRDYLRILPAHEYPRATLYVEPMIRLVSRLLEQGTSYRGDDGSVYFSIERFPAYGRLSGLDRRELKTGASERVSADDYGKDDARDFALWKAARPEDEQVGAAWDAPFGRGRPGWHLECSAMALEIIRRKFGVEELDIHAGGVDLIFPHHEDEIAQSCAFTGRELFARHWIHGEFLNIRGAKMSKRFGNVTTARDLREDGVDAGALRLLLFQTHYRQQLDLTDEALEAAQEGARRLGAFARRLRESRGDVDAPGFAEATGRLEAGVRHALDDDLNAPRAVAALFAFAAEGNRLLDGGDRPGPSTLAAWQSVDDMLDVATAPEVTEVRLTGSLAPVIDGVATPSPEPPADPDARQGWAVAWARARAAAKFTRNYPEADRIRQLLRSHGYDVRDRRDGAFDLLRLTN